ncbi:MAG: AAA family ATPase [bacterium]|nr:AAA family ATPase [bacterium]
MIELPYGIADFHRIRTQGLVYVDRTSHIRDLERLGSILVFLRPRRFGKSLWLQTLAEYYDLRRADEFDALFGDLAIGRDPTPLRNRYLVMRWNFSQISARGSVDQIAESIRRHVRSRAKLFATQYKATLPFPIEVDGDPAENAADGRHIGQAPQGPGSADHGIFLVELDVTQRTISEQQVNDEAQNDRRMIVEPWRCIGIPKMIWVRLFLIRPDLLCFKQFGPSHALREGVFRGRMVA